MSESCRSSLVWAARSWAVCSSIWDWKRLLTASSRGASADWTCCSTAVACLATSACMAASIDRRVAWLSPTVLDTEPLTSAVMVLRMSWNSSRHTCLRYSSEVKSSSSMSAGRSEAGSTGTSAAGRLRVPDRIEPLRLPAGRP
eukprot:8781840-Pyramimonas_sp.AAC.1